MRQLIIDTATEALSVALFEDSALLACHHEIAGRGHAERLIPIIAALDGGGHADEIWVDNGPGSFTGIRVGVAAARALAFAWGAHLRAYSSLSLIAAMARETTGETGDAIAVAITGGHGELFWQIFDRHSLEPQTQPASTAIDVLARELSAPTIFGTGAAALISARGYGEAAPIHPDARLARLIPATQIANDAVPFYGRGADAKPMAAQVKHP